MPVIILYDLQHKLDNFRITAVPRSGSRFRATAEIYEPTVFYPTAGTTKFYPPHEKHVFYAYEICSGELEALCSLHSINVPNVIAKPTMLPTHIRHFIGSLCILDGGVHRSRCITCSAQEKCFLSADLHIGREKVIRKYPVYEGPKHHLRRLLSMLPSISSRIFIGNVPPAYSVHTRRHLLFLLTDWHSTITQRQHHI